MTCQFDDLTTAPPILDGGNSYHECAVNHNHYLMDGVGSLFDWATGTFKYQGCTGCANALAYTADSEEPWILEEDTATAGSRVAVHDSNLVFLDPVTEDIFDVWPNPEHNFRFIYNLCTRFRQ
jgi:hypothetical protein